MLCRQAQQISFSGMNETIIDRLVEATGCTGIAKGTQQLLLWSTSADSLIERQCFWDQVKALDAGDLFNQIHFQGNILAVGGDSHQQGVITCCLQSKAQSSDDSLDFIKSKGSTQQMIDPLSA